MTSQLGGNQSFLGAHGGSGAGLQHLYPNMQVGQPTAARNQGSGGSVSGYPSYMWYDKFQSDFFYLILMYIVVNRIFYAILILIFSTYTTDLKAVKPLPSDVISKLLYG